MPIKWENSKYSEKVKKFLAKKIEDFPLLTLLDGAVRSGKTLSIIQKIPQIFDAIGNENLKVFSGYSKNTVRNNVLIELKPFIENYLSGQVKVNSASGEMEISLWGKKYNCLVIGGGDADSVSSIQGGTWDFWYANELPQHHYNFYNMALSRLTPSYAKAFADSNPESANHWLYQEKIKPYLEGDKNVRDIFEYWHFTMRDNANLSEKFIANQEKLYNGSFKTRKIDGLWAVADGLVYDTFNSEKQLSIPFPQQCFRTVLRLRAQAKACLLTLYLSDQFPDNALAGVLDCHAALEKLCADRVSSRKILCLLQIFQLCKLR